jgi:N-acyl homoserine lactone hydrolase
MSSIRIHPLHLGTLTRPKDQFGYRLQPGILIDVPLIAWYIDGAAKKILVDTGGLEPSEAPLRAPYVRKKDQTIDNALRKIGVNFRDIDIVIMTHLHWDHCGGLPELSASQIIVQEEELLSARSPLPLYNNDDLKKIIYDIDYTVISGDKQIVEGVSVIFTPGHTYGLQGVLVEAETQRYFIAGDTFCLFECLNRKPPLISGIYVDLRSYYKSMERISGLSAFVLPGHDFKVFDKEIYF